MPTAPSTARLPRLRLRAALVALGLIGAMLAGACEIASSEEATPTPTPSATEAAQATATPRPTISSGGSVYTVVAGDTLYAISVRFGTTTSELVALNNIPNPERIVVGQQIQLPSDALISTAALPEGELGCAGYVAVGIELDRMANNVLGRVQAGGGRASHSLSQLDEVTSLVRGTDDSFADGAREALLDAIAGVAVGTSSLETGRLDAARNGAEAALDALGHAAELLEDCSSDLQ